MAIAAIAIGGAFSIRTFSGQTVPPAAFDAASIKPSVAVDAFGVSTPPGRFRGTGLTLRLLIRYAYGVRDTQIVGTPPWGSTERFDIEATTGPTAVPLPQVPALVQQLLAERFHLVFHRETKEMPVFELTVDKDGAKLESAPDPKGPGAPSQPVKEGTPRPGGFRASAGQVSGSAVPLTQLVQVLSTQLGRTVIDKTGLTGFYTFALTWTPDALKGKFGDGGGPPLVNGIALDPNGPDLVTAVREQLGLKVQSSNGPVELIVVEHAEHPTIN
jgi:uncharacterized protein (TIGR03435 family)